MLVVLNEDINLLINHVEMLKNHLSREGEYSICKSDGRPLNLPEIMMLGKLFSEIECDIKNIRGK